MFELPKPVKCDGKGKRVADYSDNDWFSKIFEEVLEAATAPNAQARAEELTDIITVCTSFLDALGFDQNARCVLQARVNDKNDRRGYFKES